LDVDEEPERLVELLEQRASDWRGWALFPTNDEALTALALHRDRLMSSYQVLAPPWEVARHLLDKGLMLEAARAAGATVPRCHGPATREAAAGAGLIFPLVVKPAVSHLFAARFGCKLFIVRDRAELSCCVSRVEEAGVPCSLFDFIPGPDSQIYISCLYLDHRGEPSAGVTIHKLRQSPTLCGVARVAEVARPEPALREVAIEILRRIGFRGMAAAEFKLDPRDGTFRFLEVNGRSVIYNSLLRRAGLDLAGLAWSNAVDGRPEAPRPNGWPGVWVNLHADVLQAALGRRTDGFGLTELLRPYTRPMLEAVWSARDPRPFFAQWSRTAREGAANIWPRRRSREAGRPPPTA
jgi:predicted ATP-grasp superfamily ATP-dependent carboligase